MDLQDRIAVVDFENSFAHCIWKGVKNMCNEPKMSIKL
jgi:hypothetical protein